MRIGSKIAGNVDGETLAVPISPELVNFWTIVSARPHEPEENVVPEGRKKAGTGRTQMHHDFGREQGDLGLPMGDGYDMGLELEMQAIVRVISHTFLNTAYEFKALIQRYLLTNPQEQDRDRLGSAEVSGVITLRARPVELLNSPSLPGHRCGRSRLVDERVACKCL
jgi:hypothetical protein